MGPSFIVLANRASCCLTSPDNTTCSLRVACGSYAFISGLSSCPACPRGRLHIGNANMSELETLPLEILFHILSFTASASNPPKLRPHPINSLAAASKHLYSVVEEYTRGLLKQHVGFTPPKSSKKFTCRRKWLAEICQSCKKSSKRRAILYPTLTMCKACDREHFPKIVGLGFWSA